MEIVDRSGGGREEVVPIIRACFTGYYRWHAKRTLRDVPWVRAAVVDGRLTGFSLLTLLAPEAGYVYYLAVDPAFRRRGVGARLLDDALRLLGGRAARVVYAAVEVDNDPSLALFRGRSFREVAKDEPHYTEGGLGAYGLRAKMRIVRGEALLGLRLDPTYAGTS